MPDAVGNTKSCGTALQVPYRRRFPLGAIWPNRRALRCAGLALVMVLPALLISGCGGLVFDPSKRVGDSRGHITDTQRRPSPTGIGAQQPASIAIGDEVPEQGDSVRRGTGTFVRSVSPAGVDTTPGDVTLNFDGTDIREVVKVILGDLLGVIGVAADRATAAARHAGTDARDAVADEQRRAGGQRRHL
jgi:hypothetical protein